MNSWSEKLNEKLRQFVLWKPIDSFNLLTENCEGVVISKLFVFLYQDLVIFIFKSDLTGYFWSIIQLRMIYESTTENEVSSVVFCLLRHSQPWDQFHGTKSRHFRNLDQQSW